MSDANNKVDTPQGVTEGGGGKTGPSPELRDRVVSGDRNTGKLRDKQTRNPQARDPGETPRDKPVEEEADKDIKGR